MAEQAVELAIVTSRETMHTIEDILRRQEDAHDHSDSVGSFGYRPIARGIRIIRTIPIYLVRVGRI